MVVESVFEIIHTLRAAGTTFVVVEQNVLMTLQNVPRAYVLERGRVVLSGTAAESPRRRRSARRTSAIDRRGAMKSTMPDTDLTVTMILRHGRDTYGDSEIVDRLPERRGPAPSPSRRLASLAPAPRLGVGRRSGGDVLLEPPPARRRLPRRAEHGCGAAHGEYASRRGEQALPPRPRRGHGGDRRRITAAHPRLPSPTPRRGAHGGHRRRTGGRPPRADGRLRRAGGSAAGYDWPDVDERRPPRCVTRAVRPAGRRGWPTATARRSSTPSPSARRTRSPSTSTTGC